MAFKNRVTVSVVTSTSATQMAARVLTVVPTLMAVTLVTVNEVHLKWEIGKKLQLLIFTINNCY